MTFKQFLSAIARKTKSLSFRDLISGNFLTKRFFIRQIPFLAIIAILSFLVVDNGYYCETQIITIEKLKDSIKNTNYEAIRTDAELTTMSVQSNIEKMVTERNIPLIKQESPPVYIEKETDNN
jgi:capsular polysaccharide biosynthesis protein